jgi:parallel beta-helix repeat protein
MNKAIHRIAGLIMAIVMILGNTIDTEAAGRDYYVALTGKDTNPGTASAPFRTFAKANSVLTPGSTLYIYTGIYNQPLKITKSGTSAERITVQPLGGKVAIDLGYTTAPGIEVQASYMTINGLIVRNVRGVCVKLTGSNITVSGLVVNSCGSHGIHVNSSSQIKILNSRIFRAVQSNSRRTLTSGWGSGIKVRVSNNVLIQGNTIFHNYGEGIGIRGTNITIRGNTVYDNYSVNIYTNSENASIERNFVYCTPNSGYERNNLPAVGIGLGEEYFAGWGARLKNARVLNNIVVFCRNGVRYMGADDGVLGGGLKSAVIAYNTLYGSTNAALSIVYESAQSDSTIANNIIWQAQNNLTAIDSPVGLTFQNNLWKVAPPAALRGLGDQHGDPNFAGTPDYTPESYRLSPSSPAVGAGADTGVPDDYYAQPRGPEFDIGAIQVTGVTVNASTQDLSSPTLVEPTNTLPPTTAPAILSPTDQPMSAAMPVTPTLEVPAEPIQETVYDNTHSAFIYSEGWVKESKAAAIDGSFARTSTNGSSVTLPFMGGSFSIIYKGGPSYRKMDVYIDDVLVATIDERHEVSTYKARWDYPGQLSPGEHTLKLIFVTTSSSTNGSLDAVIVR